MYCRVFLLRLDASGARVTRRGFRLDHFLPSFIRLLVPTLLACGLAWTASAGNQTWTGGTSTDWNTAANWNSGAGPVPGTADTAIIPTGKPNYPVLTTAASTAITALNINSGGSVTINSGGTLTLSGTITVNGTLTISAGTLSIKDFASGTGTFTMIGGTLKVSRDIKFTTFTATGGTVEFTGNGDGSAFPAGAYQFYHVLIDSGVVPGFDKLAANTYSVAGNFTNNGAPVFTAKATAVSFNGTSAQYIAGSSQTTFYNLKITNSAGLTLIAGATVNNALTLTSGKITTGANTLVMAGTANTIVSNASSTSQRVP